MGIAMVIFLSGVNTLPFLQITQADVEKTVSERISSEAVKEIFENILPYLELQ